MTIEIGFSLIIVLVVVVWATLDAIQAKEASERNRIYRDATRQYPGTTVLTRQGIERDIIKLPGPPCPAQVRYFHHWVGGSSSQRKLDYSEFTGEFPWNSGAIRVSTPDWGRAIDAFYGGRDVKIGDPQFDGRYVLQSNPESLLPLFLDADTRERIIRLDKLGEETFLLEVRPGQAVIRVSKRVLTGDELQGFIADCYAVVSQLMRIGGVGDTQVRHAVEAKKVERCPICGNPIEPKRRVRCRRCKIPHHINCWAYNDGCMTFGCGERIYLWGKDEE